MGRSLQGKGFSMFHVKQLARRNPSDVSRETSSGTIIDGERAGDIHLTATAAV